MLQCLMQAVLLRLASVVPEAMEDLQSYVLDHGLVPHRSLGGLQLWQLDFPPEEAEEEQVWRGRPGVIGKPDEPRAWREPPREGKGQTLPRLAMGVPETRTSSSGTE